MMKKSDITREKILRAGFEFTSSNGLRSLSIGEIAKIADMSRTGVISHFKNTQDMQIAILEYSEAEFISLVIKKSYGEDPLENLYRLKENWVNWTTNLNFANKGSCPFIKAAIEYKDSVDCPIRTFMKDQQQRLLDYLADLATRCIQADQFKQECDVEQFSYEFYSIYLGHSLQKNLLEEATADQRFERSITELIKKSEAL
jgi:AcrR family transcriptional regulator